MRVGRGIVGPGIFTVMIVFGVGCSSSTATTAQAELEVTSGLWDVAGLLRDYSTDAGRAPTKLADLARNQTLYPRGFEAIRSGEVVVVWGVKMPPDGSGGTEVIAYEKKTPTEGGGVLLMNGEVKKMTSEEFAAAPKVKK